VLSTIAHFRAEYEQYIREGGVPVADYRAPQKADTATVGAH
jgi:hypothetical protein